MAKLAAGAVREDEDGTEEETETLQPSAWLVDFLRVTIRHLPDWSRSYRLAKETLILEGSVTFRTVSGDAAKEVRFFPQAGPLRTSGKGAFQADKAPVKHKNTVDNGAHQVLEMEADTLQDPEFGGKASSRSSTRGRRRDRGRDYSSRSRDRRMKLRY